jgi:hypothetical protein
MDGEKFSTSEISHDIDRDRALLQVPLLGCFDGILRIHDGFVTAGFDAFFSERRMKVECFSLVKRMPARNEGGVFMKLE